MTAYSTIAAGAERWTSAYDDPDESTLQRLQAAGAVNVRLETNNRTVTVALTHVPRPYTEAEHSKFMLDHARRKLAML